MVLCAILCVTANIVANRMSAISAGNITLALRHDLFQRLDRLSARQLDGLTLPSAVSRLTSDTYNVNQLLARMQRLGVRGPILLLGGVCITLRMDPGLAMVLIATLPLIGALVYFVTKASVPLYTKEQGILDRMVRVVQENITGIRVIKALSKTEYETRRFGEVNQELCAVDQKVGGITALTNPAATLILNLGLTGVVLLGAFRVNGGLTKPGVIIAFLNYFTMILNAMLGVTKIFIIWSKGEASAKRVVEVLELPEDLAVVPSQAESKAYLEFRDVCFSYNHVADNLSHLSFSLERGQTLGILGATGSGKSTLVNLLLRFYDPDTGTVFLDGRDIRTIPPEELRPKFGTFGSTGSCLKRSWTRLPGRPRRITSSRKGWATPWRSGATTCPVARNNGWPLPGLWREGRRFWCWTTPPAPWITGPTPPCARPCAGRWRA